MIIKIKNEVCPEFIGQLIDTFEDFLECKGIDIPNEEKTQEEDNTAIIYGSDYGQIEDAIMAILKRWDISDSGTEEKEK